MTDARFFIEGGRIKINVFGKSSVNLMEYSRGKPIKSVAWSCERVVCPKKCVTKSWTLKNQISM